MRKRLSWPAPQLFPALDLARLAALDGEAAERLAAGAGGVALESAAGGVLAVGGQGDVPQRWWVLHRHAVIRAELRLWA